MAIIVAPLQLLEEQGVNAFQRALDAAAAATPLVSPPDTPAPPIIAEFAQQHRAELLGFAAEHYQRLGAGAIYVYDRLDEPPATPQSVAWAQSYPRAGIGGYLVVYVTARQLRERGQPLLATLAGQWSGAESAPLIVATAHHERPDVADQIWAVVVKREENRQ